MGGASTDGTISTGASMATTYGSLGAWISRRRYGGACEASEGGLGEAWGQRASRFPPLWLGVDFTKSQQFCKVRAGLPKRLELFSVDIAGCEGL
jgi:hypothetical protein